MSKPQLTHEQKVAARKAELARLTPEQRAKETHASQPKPRHTDLHEEVRQSDLEKARAKARADAAALIERREAEALAQASVKRF
jgi:hypothetical protein